ncbi:hypothetical protein CMV_010897 [Castanea mollissima]|uniref:Uncharacterized protein n=1 Tax=Castanea mollissima TaxID=60419 RepID=A0A8J4REC5_9ROSI|nr:hypothetical protein CMV_010897 [Castanea mollissima]
MLNLLYRHTDRYSPLFLHAEPPPPPHRSPIGAHRHRFRRSYAWSLETNRSRGEPRSKEILCFYGEHAPTASQLRKIFIGVELNTKMQQQSLQFLTTVPTDADETELAGIREVGRYSVGNMECKE